MRSEELITELAGLIRRLERKVRTSPRLADLLDVDTEQESQQQALDALEDAIVALVVLHIQLRRKP